MSVSLATVTAGIPRVDQAVLAAAKRAMPSTICVYLYANGDPVMGRDPSGHMTLMELGVAETISAFLDKALIVYRVWGVYNKIQTIIGAIEYVKGITNLIYDPSVLFEHLNVYKKLAEAGSEFGRIVSREGIEDGFYTLASNAPRIVSELMSRPDLLKQVGNIKRFFIEMPTPYPGIALPEFNIPTRLKIMNTPVFLRFFGRGSKGGRFIGMAVNGNKNDGPTQLWRMDWHSPDGNQDWRDGRWHFHVGGVKK